MDAPDSGRVKALELEVNVESSAVLHNKSITHFMRECPVLTSQQCCAGPSIRDQAKGPSRDRHSCQQEGP